MLCPVGAYTDTVAGVTSTKPQLVLLGADDAPGPYNLADLEALADVRQCTVETLPQVLPGADAVSYTHLTLPTKRIV